MAKTRLLFNVLPAFLIVGAVGAPAQQQQRPNVDLGLTGQFVFRISAVQAGSPAEAARLKPGDILRRVGRTLIHSSEDLKQFGISHMPGETVEIAYERRETQVTSTQPGLLRTTVQLRAPNR